MQNKLKYYGLLSMMLLLASVIAFAIPQASALGNQFAYQNNAIGLGANGDFASVNRAILLDDNSFASSYRDVALNGDAFASNERDIVLTPDSFHSRDRSIALDGGRLQAMKEILR